MALILIRRAIQYVYHQARGGIFIRPVLCICIVCLLNTLFFAIVKRPFQFHQQLSEKKSLSYNSDFASKGERVKFAKSLLRLVLEKYMANTSDASDHQENKHEELHRIEYISQYTTCLFLLPYVGELPATPYTKPVLNRPFIDMLTPPPKGIA